MNVLNRVIIITTLVALTIGFIVGYSFISLKADSPPQGGIVPFEETVRKDAQGKYKLVQKVKGLNLPGVPYTCPKDFVTHGGPHYISHNSAIQLEDDGDATAAAEHTVRHKVKDKVLTFGYDRVWNYTQGTLNGQPAYWKKLESSTPRIVDLTGTESLQIPAKKAGGLFAIGKNTNNILPKYENVISGLKDGEPEKIDPENKTLVCYKVGTGGGGGE